MIWKFCILFHSLEKFPLQKLQLLNFLTFNFFSIWGTRGPQSWICAAVHLLLFHVLSLSALPVAAVTWSKTWFIQMFNSYAILNINYVTFSRPFLDIFQTFPYLTFLYGLPTSNTGIRLFNTTKVKFDQSWIKYYENACPKIKSGKLVSFFHTYSIFFLDIFSIHRGFNI